MPNSTAFFSWRYGLALSWLGIMAVIAFFVPLFGQDATFIHVDDSLLPPLHPTFWLGTDDLGRDLLARLAVGARISLLVGGATGLLATLIGVGLGILTALTENSWFDKCVQWLMTLIYSLPGLMIVILGATFLQPLLMLGIQNALGLQSLSLEWRSSLKVFSLISTLTLFAWPDTVRIIRAKVRQLKQEPFVEAYWSHGGSWARLISHQLLPHLWPLALLATTITVPRAILTESTLSLIGLGIEAPLSSTALTTHQSTAGKQLHLAQFASILPINPMARNQNQPTITFNCNGEVYRHAKFSSKRQLFSKVPIAYYPLTTCSEGGDTKPLPPLLEPPCLSCQDNTKFCTIIIPSKPESCPE
jgi:ABC-type dipeptide/oligopeptide/nickel transport system permease subunit